MSCRHVNTSGYRCSRPSLPAHRGYCRQHASLLHLPPPVPPPSQPSRRGGRGGGVGRPSTTAAAVPHAVSETRRRSSSVGRTPTVEQLLGRIDRLRASSPSAESAWSEDSDHETPTLGSSRQYAGSGCTGDSSEAESGPEGPEPVDLLHHAGIYTAEEAALLARDKLVRQQALYIQQFSRLQHLLREGRRKYLQELKLERQAEAEASKERQLAAEAGEDNSEQTGHSERGSTVEAVPGRSSGRSAPQRNRHDTEEKLRAVWRYHRHRGVCAVLRRKAWDRRADSPAPPGPRCIHTEGGVRCSERCLPGSKYCLKHILNDPHQMLYVPCVGRRNLTLEQRDEEFSRSRRKARRTSTGSRTSGANTTRQPVPTSSRTSARASARGMNPAVAAVLAARGRAVTVNRASAPRSRVTAPNRKEAVVGVVAPTPRNRDAATRAVPPKAEGASSSRGNAGAAVGTSGKARSLKPLNVKALQRAFKTKMAAEVTAAVKNKDAAAFAAACGIEKTPSVEKLVRRRTAARIADAIEKRDTATVLAARTSGRKSRSSSEKVAMPKEVRRDSAREVIDKSKKIAALAAVLQSEEAMRLIAALKSEDASAMFAALKSKDATAVVAALRAKDAIALAAALKPGVPLAESGSPSVVPTEEAVRVQSVQSVSATNVSAPITPAASGVSSNVPTALRFKDAVALMASLKPADKAAVIAALKSKDTGALKAVLKSKSVAPVIADLKAKGLIVSSKATKSEAKTQLLPTEGLRAMTTAVRPDSTASGDVSSTQRQADVAGGSSIVETENMRATVSVRSGSRAALVAALKSENAGALAAVLKSRSVAALSAALRSRATAMSPKSKVIAARGLALKGKVSAAVRTKSAAAKAAAAKLKAATTTLAARKAKKRVRCQEPVLCVFEMDMRCPWHAVYVPDDRHTAEGVAGGSGVPKEEIKVPKEEPDEDRGASCFGPINKKMKMELDELTPDIGCIVGEVEMKMETNDDAADDMASVSGSGNQADLSTESTLSATSPRADDDDMDDDCRDMDIDVDTGAEEVVLQPPLGADDADLVAVAQGVAMVGAQEEVAVIQQDDDSLTNPPAAVDEVEVS